VQRRGACGPLGVKGVAWAVSPGDGSGERGALGLREREGVGQARDRVVLRRPDDPALDVADDARGEGRPLGQRLLREACGAAMALEQRPELRGLRRVHGVSTFFQPSRAARRRVSRHLHGSTGAPIFPPDGWATDPTKLTGIQSCGVVLCIL